MWRVADRERIITVNKRKGSNWDGSCFEFTTTPQFGESRNTMSLRIPLDVHSGFDNDMTQLVRICSSWVRPLHVKIAQYLFQGCLPLLPGQSENA